MIAAFLMAYALTQDMSKQPPKIIKTFSSVEACEIEANKHNVGMNTVLDSGSIADEGVVHFCAKIIYPT